MPLRHVGVSVEGDLDLRGTLGLAPDAPVGFARLHVRFALGAPEAPEELLQSLREKTERYCIVLQTLTTPPELRTEWSASPSRVVR